MGGNEGANAINCIEDVVKKVAPQTLRQTMKNDIRHIPTRDDLTLTTCLAQCNA